jgi:hypothetical protein
MIDMSALMQLDSDFVVLLGAVGEKTEFYIR